MSFFRSNSVVKKWQALVDTVIAECGAQGGKDMGRVMKALMPACFRPRRRKAGERCGQGKAGLSPGLALMLAGNELLFKEVGAIRVIVPSFTFIGMT